jgi:hypothetical protein
MTGERVLTLDWTKPAVSLQVLRYIFSESNEVPRGPHQRAHYATFKYECYDVFGGSQRGQTLAYKFKILPEKRVAFFKFWDDVSTVAAKEAFVRYTKDEDFDPAYLMVTDAREVTSIHATFQGILFGVEGLRDLLAKFERGTISAILVSDSTQFGYARMLEQVLDFLSPITVRIAFDEDELRTLAKRPELSIADLATS